MLYLRGQWSVVSELSDDFFGGREFIKPLIKRATSPVRSNNPASSLGSK